jgi:hypothetical protein
VCAGLYRCSIETIAIAIFTSTDPVQ